MQIGMVGLGKMGANMVKRLVGDDHEPVGFDLDEESVREAEEAGARGAGSLEELVEALEPPRAIWIMVPHGEPTRQDRALADRAPGAGGRDRRRRQLALVRLESGGGGVR